MSGIIGVAGSRSGIIGQTELDYEEGTFDVTFEDSEGTDATMHSTRRTLHYTKVGRLVTCFGNLETTSVSGVGNSTRMFALPFACNSSAPGTGYLGLAEQLALDKDGYTLNLYIPLNTTFAYFSYWNAHAGSSGLDGEDWSDDGFGYFNIQYII